MTVSLAPDVATLVLALGLIVSLCCYVVSHVSPGGMITPGWISLTLVQDVRLAPLVIGVVLVTFASARGVEHVAILYGKRLFASVLLLGVFFSTTVLLVCSAHLPALTETGALGLVAPGLIAYQLIRQPVVPTLVATAATTSVTYALVLAGVMLGVVPTLDGAPALSDLRLPASEHVIRVALAALVGALALAILTRLLRRIDWAAFIIGLRGPQPAVAFASTGGGNPSIAASGARSRQGELDAAKLARVVAKLPRDERRRFLLRLKHHDEAEGCESSSNDTLTVE